MSDFIHPFLDTMTLKPNQSPEMAAFSIAQEVGYGSILYQDQKPMGGVQLADAPGSVYYLTRYSEIIYVCVCRISAISRQAVGAFCNSSY